MTKNIECKITITEVDGKLAILANIPDEFKNTVAGALTKALIEKSADIMNEILGQRQVVQTVSSH